MTLCRRNCHVNPHKIKTCFRAFPKFKLINAPHLYLTQIGVGLGQDTARIPFLKAKWVHKTGCAVCAIYASCAGTVAHRHNNRIMMMTFIDTKYVSVILLVTILNGMSASSKHLLLETATIRSHDKYTTVFSYFRS